MEGLALTPALNVRPRRPAIVEGRDTRIRFVAHRCGCDIAPENTISAALQAAARGVDYLEIDIRESADATPFVVHDSTLDRTTNGSGLVAEHAAGELDTVDAGAWFAPEFSGEPLPRFDRFLDAVDKRAGLYIEIKDGFLTSKLCGLVFGSYYRNFKTRAGAERVAKALEEL